MLGRKHVPNKRYAPNSKERLITSNGIQNTEIKIAIHQRFLFSPSTNLPVILKCRLPFPVLPSLSVTVQVCVPESMDRSSEIVTVSSVWPATEHCPEQLEDHRYVTGWTASKPTWHISVTEVATWYMSLLLITVTVRLGPIGVKNVLNQWGMRYT